MCLILKCGWIYCLCLEFSRCCLWNRSFFCVPPQCHRPQGVRPGGGLVWYPYIGGILCNFQRAQIQQFVYIFPLFHLVLRFSVVYPCILLLDQWTGQTLMQSMYIYRYIVWNIICSLVVYLRQLHGVVYLLLFAGLERAQAQWRSFPRGVDTVDTGTPKILTFEGINVRLENVGDLCMDP